MGVTLVEEGVGVNKTLQLIISNFWQKFEDTIRIPTTGALSNWKGSSITEGNVDTVPIK